jgi:TnsA endonuclease N terminal
VIYESRLELARLMIADFDPAVVAIAAQPFWLRARAGGRVRRHVPDFFLLRADQSAVLVNVKPAAQLADPEVAEALEWPGRLARDHGWYYEIWTGADPVYLANVRFLAGYRRPRLVPCWPRSGRVTRSLPCPAVLAGTIPRTPSGLGLPARSPRREGAGGTPCRTGRVDAGRGPCAESAGDPERITAFTASCVRVLDDAAAGAVPGEPCRRHTWSRRACPLW